ncbi:helix-turn-helix domain-containing protein [Nocardiopsis sp. RSe5-2]|uniref:Helix-turn-helix domain-containing protein n=1 Tax=Nocardiopsis endophytica TaxID=3018445 RepID=A0ABT4UD11_9ACTN|nr:helix-turn-helix domain-containing protein [Nocardiopsis endophytica]MDA2814843.1 helix-turn-helix domain-containing protein [Nocardiopsis endophytica]
MRDLDARLARRLAALRTEHGWSLDALAGATGISRSTLSRIERAEISPTAALLGSLGAAYGRTPSQLLAEAEPEPPRLVRAEDQDVWRDEATGFDRRTVSPPHPSLRAEMVQGELRPGADIAYPEPPVPGLEQHVWILSGELHLTADGTDHRLQEGDCLRFRLWGPTRFRCPGPDPVRYAVVLVRP